MPVKNLAAGGFPKLCSGTAQTTAFMGTVMMCKLLNLSTCVLNVFCHKYCGEVERPLALQFIIPTIRSVFMTPHWKDGALPQDELMTLNPPWLVLLSGCWQNQKLSLPSADHGHTYHSVCRAGADNREALIQNEDFISDYKYGNYRFWFVKVQMLWQMTLFQSVFYVFMSKAVEQSLCS